MTLANIEAKRVIMSIIWATSFVKQRNEIFFGPIAFRVCDWFLMGEWQSWHLGIENLWDIISAEELLADIFTLICLLKREIRGQENWKALDSTEF